MEGAQGVSAKTQLSLFSCLGAAYICGGGDTITSLQLADESLIKAQEIAAEIGDKRSQESIDGERNEIGRRLPKIRGEQQAWGSAGIDEYEKEHLLYVGRTYTLTARVGWGDAPPTQDEVVTFTVPQSPESFEFDISVWAEDIEVEPKWQTLKLDPASDLPNLVRFKLTPKVAGQKIIKVRFYYQLHWLQQIKFPVEVAPSPIIRLDAISGDVSVVQPLRVGMLMGRGGLGDKSFTGLCPFARQKRGGRVS